jgi:hypothetical protein
LKKSFSWCVLAAGLAMTTPVQAVCVYDGKHFQKSDLKEFGGRLSARTSLGDEFADAMIVVRGKIVSAREIPVPRAQAKNPDAEDGVLYRIQVEKVFKGAPGQYAQNYTEHDSGAFYLDQGTSYLLFLNPMAHDDPALHIAPGALRVNYACGQSQSWNRLSAAQQRLLANLAAAAK